MRYPNDAGLRERYHLILEAQRSESVHPVILEAAADAMAEPSTRAARRAITAGDALAILYALDTSPWSIPEPSLGKVEYVLRRFGDIEQYGDGETLPTGKTEIRRRIEEFRQVWHLWAAWRLLREFPTRDHRELTRTSEGLSDLLGAARSIQVWADGWLPKRGEKKPLLDADAWRVPDSIVPRKPPWSYEPDWLVAVLRNYQPRSRE
jgi:hypothetical protein